MAAQATSMMAAQATSMMGEPNLDLREEDLDPKDKWEVIGQGGFAKVYRAYCHVHNGYVAVKEVRNGYQVKEVQKLVKLVLHDNVVRIKGVDPKNNYIIMEYCSYSLSQLRTRLDSHYIPWPRCIHFMQNIMSGLAFLIRCNIIHRDIKPENVMVTDRFICKIGDFGLAKDQASYTNSKTNSGIVQPSGSLLFISPERLKYPNKKASESDDIYSCAMLFYKMITNADLFCMETRPPDEAIFCDLKLYVVDKQYRHELNEIEENCPDIVKTVIGACWHRTPGERETFTHWATLLRDHIKDHVTEDELTTADAQLKRLLKGSQLPVTECDASKISGSSPGIREPQREDDQPDSPTEDDPPPPTLQPVRGSADGLDFHIDEKPSISEYKGLRGLERGMSNLAVESDDNIDIFILSDYDTVLEYYRLEAFTSYKLSLDKNSNKLRFSQDGSDFRLIPMNNIISYAVKQDLMTLKLRTGFSKEILNLHFSASSLDRFIDDLHAYGFRCSDVSDSGNSVRKDDKNGNNRGRALRGSLSVPDEGHYHNNPSQGPNQYPQFCQHHGYSCYQQPQHLTGNPPCQTGHPPCQTGHPPYQTGHSPYQTGHPPYQSGQHQQPYISQAPQSYISIHHVENFHNGPVSAPVSNAVTNPPYPQSILTDSAREVNDEDFLKIQDHVASKYQKVAALLKTTTSGAILQNTNRNFEEASYQLLRAWHQENGSDATIHRLATILYFAKLYDAAILLE